MLLPEKAFATACVGLRSCLRQHTLSASADKAGARIVQFVMIEALTERVIPSKDIAFDGMSSQLEVISNAFGEFFFVMRNHDKCLVRS